jgi:hypothetical protein
MKNLLSVGCHAVVSPTVHQPSPSLHVAYKEGMARSLCPPPRRELLPGGLELSRRPGQRPGGKGGAGAPRLMARGVLAGGRSRSITGGDPTRGCPGVGGTPARGVGRRESLCILPLLSIRDPGRKMENGAVLEPMTWFLAVGTEDSPTSRGVTGGASSCLRRLQNSCLLSSGGDGCQSWRCEVHSMCSTTSPLGAQNWVQDGGGVVAEGSTGLVLLEKNVRNPGPRPGCSILPKLGNHLLPAGV